MKDKDDFLQDIENVLDNASETLDPYEYADFLDAASEAASSRIPMIEYGDEETGEDN